MIKLTQSLLLIWLTGVTCFAQGQQKVKQQTTVSKKVTVAYVTSWTSVMPDPAYITHINYAFGHVDKDFNGIRIDNENRLRSLIDLKTKYPQLKVLISIGGWGSGRFSEMAAFEDNRNKFAEDCLRIINEYKLDGIDIDWEYPTSAAAKISSSPEDTQNYNLMMKAIRSKIGTTKLLTLASVADAKYIDFKTIEPLVDFVNIMTYDMGNPPNHNAGLYRSKYTGWISVDEGMTAHLNAGMPLNKLVLGIPFYGHGKNGVANFIDYKDVVKLNGFKNQWDDDAKVPFLENDKGEFVCSYENPESIAIKCNYILTHGMLGAMYWEYAGDTEEGVLIKAVYLGVNKSL
ncbi:MAG: glycoside hydrolase family 18 protein [Candidatus Pedobacter colombiensis]|uniref:chitinase n=1 Tax=Candidatus Pedobacter colombiensis TaxID=3121371 RepID=A0AAJ6B7Q7_9SPHI|nr:glycoside hydrolase family 18 protein [Pedobacter sp.]WEK20119.1 MAG: glycoside hydrolase family 18 protein [Pedobacter sp.]